MPDVRDSLQAHLSNAYDIDRELQGGAMSHVLLATERQLHRRVVIKVLPADLTESVSAERFGREIELLASLQHPNIVPVLTASVTRELAYYTMPFVEGQSLRVRLSSRRVEYREAINILRDVLRALDCAHARGIVHRDIKPDNILLSHGAAIVSDFGIAKAIAASRAEPGATTLTSTGVFIGTPAYMSPEQALGDADVDQRSDIYAFGMVAYELLTGQLPFDGDSAQQIISAKLTRDVPPLGDVRRDIPRPIATILTRCLERDRDRRPTTAAEVLAVLDTPGHAETPPSVARVLVTYAAACGGVAISAWIAMIALGLPEWVVPGALSVMALGLPFVLLMLYVQHVRQRVSDGSYVATPVGGIRAPTTMTTLALRVSPYVSWRRTRHGGVAALGAFAFAIAAFMTLRALGIGPAGSLLAAGKLRPREPLVVADFTTKGSVDTSLAPVLAEAVRADLSESRAISVLPTSVIRPTLERMQMPPTTRVNAAIARSIALRQGSRAVVDGDITPVGSGFIITERLLAASSGDELAGFQATANTAAELIPAIQKATRALRAKMGESLRQVRASPSLAQVTTPSIEALRKYQQGVDADEFRGDYDAAVRLLREAVAIDTSFAMAWRKLGAAYSHARYPAANVDEAQQHAYANASHLTEPERLAVTADHYARTGDRARASAAREAFLAYGLPPTDRDLLAQTQNQGTVSETRRQYARAESLYRIVLLHEDVPQTFNALINALEYQGKWRVADSAYRVMAARFPEYYVTLERSARLLAVAGSLDSAAHVLETLRHHASAPVRIAALADLAPVYTEAGRLRDASRARAASVAELVTRGAPRDTFDVVLDDARDGLTRGDTAGAISKVEALVRTDALQARRLRDDAYYHVATFFAQAGAPARARAMLTQMDAEVRDTAYRRLSLPARHATLAEIALAEGHPSTAVAEFFASDSLPDGPALRNVIELYAELGRAFDAAQAPDSAIAYFERYLSTPNAVTYRIVDDAVSRPSIERRLGELYEARGQSDQARKHYEMFLRLWKSADSDLAKQVDAVRSRMNRLPAAGRRAGD